MRDQMRIGELAFFYHSNCKEPGIAGIMEVSWLRSKFNVSWNQITYGIKIQCPPNEHGRFKRL